MATMQETKPVRRQKRKKLETSIVFSTVSRVQRYRSRVQRITLWSDEFPGFITDVPDQFITFLFPKGDRKAPAIGRDFDWDEWYALPEAERPHARNYTVRHYRPEVGEIDVDMILHGEESIGSAWAMHAEPGDAMALWGPRVAYDPPPNVDWLLLLGDDAGVPAIAAILDTLPANVSARVIAEVDGPDAEYPLESAAAVDVTWLHRRDQPVGESQALIDAVRAVELPEGVRYAWGGGEFRTMSAIGKHLRRERGFRPSDVSTIGYW